MAPTDIFIIRAHQVKPEERIDYDTGSSPCSPPFPNPLPIDSLCNGVTVSGPPSPAIPTPSATVTETSGTATSATILFTRIVESPTSTESSIPSPISLVGSENTSTSSENRGSNTAIIALSIVALVGISVVVLSTTLYLLRRSWKHKSQNTKPDPYVVLPPTEAALMPRELGYNSSMNVGRQSTTQTKSSTISTLPPRYTAPTRALYSLPPSVPPAASVHQRHPSDTELRKIPNMHRAEVGRSRSNAASSTVSDTQTSSFHSFRKSTYLFNPRLIEQSVAHPDRRSRKIHQELAQLEARIKTIEKFAGSPTAFSSVPSQVYLN